jgi:hypothetical protein
MDRWHPSSAGAAGLAVFAGGFSREVAEKRVAGVRTLVAHRGLLGSARTA